MGELMDGRRGLVPSNFVERVPGWIFNMFSVSLGCSFKPVSKPYMLQDLGSS